MIKPGAGEDWDRMRLHDPYADFRFAVRKCAMYLHTLDVGHVKLLVTSVANLQSKMARCVVVVGVIMSVVLCI